MELPSGYLTISKFGCSAIPFSLVQLAASRANCALCASVVVIELSERITMALKRLSHL